MSSSILGFNIEWYDNVSNITHTLCLKFFVDDNTIEILREKSAFLKRIYYPEVKFSDLFLGNTITIHNRLYTVTSYANKFTTEFMEDHEVHFIGVISSNDLDKVGDVLNLAKKKNLVVAKLFTTQSETAIDSSSGKDSFYINIQPGDTVIEFVGITLEMSTKGLSFDDFVAATKRICSNIIFTRASVDVIQVRILYYFPEIPLIFCSLFPIV
jgi:hypothetical protein